jgi:hypothetical protein
VNKLAIALLLGTFFAVGCGDKTDTAASGSAKASGAPASSAKGSAAAATTGGGSSGNKVCDEYWTKVKACNEKAISGAPEGPGRDAAKKAIEDSEKMTKEQWAKMEGPALEAACKAMIDGLAQNPNCPK